MNRSFEISLSKKDEKDLKEIAINLGISKKEVLRKALKLMALYNELVTKGNYDFYLKTNQENIKLIVL